MGRKCVAFTPLGNKMLFVAIVKIMTHQMEHFKEIHTRLSWLTSFPILSLLCFPHTLPCCIVFWLPWGISHSSKKHKVPLTAFTLHTENCAVRRHTGKWNTCKSSVWILTFSRHIFFCVCLLFNVYKRVRHCLCCVCLCVCLSLCVPLQRWPFHPCFVPD